MRIFWSMSGKEVTDGEVTKEQWEAIDILRQRHGLTDNVRIQTEFGGDSIMLETTHSTFGVEPDGYVHTCRVGYGNRDDVCGCGFVTSKTQVLEK